MVQFAESIAHVDMDAFFVEVERRRRPELRGLAVVVGGLGSRGVVASASYEARRRGLSSAMPIDHARRLCPHARFIAPDHTAYRAASAEVLGVLRGFTPLVEPVSVDEAFLDIGGLRLIYTSPKAVGVAMREGVRRETGLPVSVGIATTKLLAKLSSKMAKPDGLVLVVAGTELAVLHPLDVRALWGVGEATFARLEQLGIETIGDLAGFPRAALERRLGSSSGGVLWELANGRDERMVEPPGAAKSVSVEETFVRDLDDDDEIDRELVRLCDRLGRRLRLSGMVGRTVTLKLRFADFSTVTRSHTASIPVFTSHDLRRHARDLLGRARSAGGAVRLLGVGVGHLEGASSPRQMSLDAQPWEQIDEAVARVRDRFGDGAVGPARLVGGGPAVLDEADRPDAF